MGIFKRLWAVVPPGNSNAAIPEDATANAMSPRERLVANKRVYKNVFPVPPGPSTKKARPCESPNDHLQMII